MHATTIKMYKSDLCDIILEVSKSDHCYVDIKATLQEGMLQQNLEGYELKEDAILMFRHRVYVPNNQKLKSLLFSEMHKVPYVGHPGYQKTIIAIKKQYFWPSMKRDVVDFIARCLECQKVKAEHIHRAGFLQPFPIPEWKWEVVTMDFTTKLPNSINQNDSIMVVVDKLTKAAHFIPVKSAHKASNIAEIYM
jgi:hypothetical protein